MDDIAEWTGAYERVSAFTAGIGAEEAGRRVPACPDWTVRELLAHMIGLDADVLANNEDSDHNETWTQAQVDARQGRDVPALLAEWQELAGPLQEWMRQHNTRPLGDVVIHEQDLRGALDIPGGQDNAGLQKIRDTFVGRFGDRVADLPPIQLAGEHWSWTSGDGAGEPEVVVQASDFDLARAILSRRSANQLRHWTTQGDIEPYLPAFAGLGPLPDDDLSE